MAEVEGPTDRKIVVFRESDQARVPKPRGEAMRSRKAVVRWLLDSDPSIRWQVMRDLTDEPDEAVAAERSRVAAEGWGAKLLALQAPGGHWGADDDDGWMTTVYALALLKDLGVDPAGEKVQRAIEPRAGAHHLVATRRPALLRRRDRGLHQRQDPGRGRLFRRGERPAGRPPPRRAARGRRLELRGAAEHAILVPLHDLRPRRAARIREGARRRRPR